MNNANTTANEPRYGENNMTLRELLKHIYHAGYRSEYGAVESLLDARRIDELRRRCDQDDPLWGQDWVSHRDELRSLNIDPDELEESILERCARAYYRGVAQAQKDFLETFEDDIERVAREVIAEEQLDQS